MTLLTMFCAATVAAVVLPGQIKEEDYLYIDISNSRVFTYKYGLAIYEKSTRQFYNVSPFDMYYRDEYSSPFQQLVGREADKNSVFSWSDNILSVESNYSNISKKLYRILSYFALATPKATFEKNGQEVVIKVKKTSNNKLTFYLDFSNFKKQTEMEMSFTLNDEDIIIDDKNNIYIPYESTKIADYLNIMHKPGYTIKTYTDIPYQMETSYFIITNSNMSGYYKIHFENQRVFTNLPAKKINFTVDSADPKFDVETGDYLSQSLNNINVGL